MNWRFELERLEDARRVVRGLLGLSGALLLSTLCLSIAILKKDETWLLIPQYNVDRPVTVKRSGWSAAYLIDWADGVVSSAFTVSPETVDRRHADLLKISKTGAVALQEHLKKEAETIKKNRMETAFYAKEFEVDEDRRIVEVKGQFLAYLGRDKAPVALDKTFLISYEQGRHGLLLLANIAEKEG